MALSSSDIKIIIDAESAKASAEIKKLTKDIEKMNRKIATGGKENAYAVGQMTRSFKSLTAHVSKLAIIYGSFHALVSGSVTTAKFETSIKRLGVYSGATASELAKLEESALHLGETTVFSASQVADGMNEMALGGLTANEQLAGIGDVLNLASVGMIGLSEATNIAVTAMKSFDLQATDINDITDIIAKGATISATNITQLGQALAKVGTVAKAYNVSLAETTSALGVLADSGRRGAEAGTQLKIVMSRLAGNSEALKYIKQLKDSTTGLAVSMYDAQTGALLPFKEQVLAIGRGLENLSAIEKNIMLGKIVGEEGKASFIALLNNMDKYEDKLKKIRQAMAENFASNSAKAIMDTLLGSFKELTSALDGLVLKVGAELTPVLREMLDSATDAILGLDSETVRDFAQAIGFLIETTVTMVGAFAKIGGVIVKLGSDYTALATLIAGTTIAMRQFAKMGLLTATASVSMSRSLRLIKVELYGISKAIRNFVVANPYTLIAGAIGGVVAIALDLYDNLEKRQKEFDDSMKESGKTVKEVFDNLEKYYDNAKGKFVMSPDEQREEIANIRASIEVLQKKREEVIKGNKADGEKIAIINQIDKDTQKLIDKTTEIKEALAKKTREVEKATIAWKENKKITADAVDGFTDFLKVYDKLVLKATQAIGKTKSQHDKLLLSIKKMEKEGLDITKEYANKRIDVMDKFNNIEFELSKKGLNDYEAYQKDKTRIAELANKAQEALSKGNLDQASRYYSEMESLVSSFAGEEIKVNDAVLVDRKATLREAQNHYKTIKAGELKILQEQERKELEAHKFKLEMMEIELLAIKANYDFQVKSLEKIHKIKKEAEENIYKFGDEDFAKEFEDKLKSVFNTIKDKKAEIQVKLDKTKFNKEYNETTKQIDELKNPAKVKVDTEELEEAKEVAYKLITVMNKDGSFSMKTVVDNEEVVDTQKAINDLKISVSDPVGVKIDVDQDEVDKAEDQLMALEGWAESNYIDMDLRVPTEKLDATEEKIMTLTYGEYKVKVGADTTPLDFGISAKIAEWKTNEDKSKELVMVVNPEFQKMEKRLADMRKKEKKKPIEIETETKTDDVVKEVDAVETEVEARPPMETKITANNSMALTVADQTVNQISAMQSDIRVGADTRQGEIDVQSFVRWINSQVAYVKVYADYQYSNGGLVPQRLADGGTFTGSGRVAGYDPTDSDKVNAKLTGGEYVVKREAVDAYGLSLLDAINRMSFSPTARGYSEGGVIGGDISPTVSRNINLNFIGDDGEQMVTQTDEATADSLERYFRRYAQ